MSEAGKVRLQEARLSDVCRYFARGYDGSPEVLDFYVDPAKNTVVFRLYFPPEQQQSSGGPQG